MKLKMNLVENGVGVNKVTIYVKERNVSLYWEAPNGNLLFTGEHTLEIFRATKLPAGKNTVCSVVVKDVSNNFTQYSGDELSEIMNGSNEIRVTVSDYNHSI